MSWCEKCGRYHLFGRCNDVAWIEARKRMAEEWIAIWRRKHRAS